MSISNLGSRISAIRKKSGLSQEELANLAGVNLRTVQRIESGKTKPRGYTLKQLAKSLDHCSGKELLNSLQESRGFLYAMNLLVFLALFAPALGTLLLVMTWLVKKERIKGVDQLGKQAINYHLTLYLFCFVLA